MGLDHRPVSPLEEKPYNHNTQPPPSPYRAELQHTGPIRAEMPTPPPQVQQRNDHFPLQELPPNQQYGYQPVNRYPSPNPQQSPSPHLHPNQSPNLNQGGYYEVPGQHMYPQAPQQSQPQYPFPQAGTGMNNGVYEMGDGRGTRF